MRTLVALGVLLSLTVSAAGAVVGEGHFMTDGVTEFQGLESSAFLTPTIVVSTWDESGLAFDFMAATIAVERDWADVVYLEGVGPLASASQPVEWHHEEVLFTDVDGALSAVTFGPEPTGFIAYGPGFTATLAPPESASLEPALAGSADPYNDVVDAGERQWWRPNVDVPVHLAMNAQRAVLTLTGDFDVFLFQADWTAGGQTFRTGVVQEGPGRATVERDILHFRGATLTLRAPEASILAPAIDADLSGTLRLDEATGYYQEEDGARWEANDLPALLQGSFQLHAEAVDAETTSLALQGDLVHASLAQVQAPATITAAKAGTAAAVTGGALALVVGAVVVARRGRERWIAGHVDTAPDCVEHALQASAEGRDAEALRWYRRARALSPNDALLALDEGHAADAVGDAVAARRAYEDALKLDPDLPEAHLRYARSLALQGLQPAALSHLGRALALEPGLAADIRADAAFAAWRDHPRFADLLRHYRK